jgi:hypothetical protein
MGRGRRKAQVRVHADKGHHVAVPKAEETDLEVGVTIPSMRGRSQRKLLVGSLPTKWKKIIKRLDEESAARQEAFARRDALAMREANERLYGR